MCVCVCVCAHNLIVKYKLIILDCSTVQISQPSTSVNYDTKYKAYKLVKLDSARSKKITN